MDSIDLSIEGISAMKMAEVQNKFAVQVMKTINDQNEVSAAAIESMIVGATGKGGVLNIVA